MEWSSLQPQVNNHSRPLQLALPPPKYLEQPVTLLMNEGLFAGFGSFCGISSGRVFT